VGSMAARREAVNPMASAIRFMVNPPSRRVNNCTRKWLTDTNNIHL
jgi:hypothetical protein